MSSSEASVCSSRRDPKAQYKMPEGYDSEDGSGACPSSYNYDTEEIVDSSSKDKEPGIHFYLNWELDSSKPVVDEETGEVNDLVSKVTPASKKMKKIFRQEFKTPPESIENKKELNNADLKIEEEVKNKDDIKTPPSKVKQELTLMEFGFKPRSSKCASSSSTPVSVAKVPDRKDTYLIDNKSFQTPPYIKKERADRQERKAKLAAIKALHLKTHIFM
jgi:hypothetical protein